MPDNACELGIGECLESQQGAGISERNFANLINSYPEGRPQKAPWAGFWWPYTKQGIAAKHGPGGKSPAGKYDAARGVGPGGRRYNAQAWEALYHGPGGSNGVPKADGWWGHCNGWSSAAALYPEPREPKQYGNITFSVGDQKALLTEAGMLTSADFFGERTDYDSDPQWKRDDVVPNQFFLVMTNYMGMLKMGVLMDRYTTTQVWNQAIAGYRFEYPKPEDYIGAHPSVPGIHRVLTTVTIWWAEDGVPSPDAVTPPFEWRAQSGYYSERTLKMELWLDGPVEFGADGRIVSSGNLVISRGADSNSVVGGDWRNGGLSSDSHPDFLWIPYSILNATDPNQNATTDTHANNQIDLQWILKHGGG